MKDKKEQEIEGKQIKETLDAVLSLEKITVSEDLIARTLKRIQESEEAETIECHEAKKDTEQKEKQQETPKYENKKPLWRRYLSYGMATAAAVGLLFISLQTIMPLFAEKNESMELNSSVMNTTSADASGEYKNENGGEGFQEENSICDAVGTDEATVTNPIELEVENNQNANGIEIEEYKIVFDVAPDFVYSCGVEYGSVYLLYVCVDEEEIKGLLYRVNSESGALEQIRKVQLEALPEKAVYSDAELKLLVNGEWIVAVP